MKMQFTEEEEFAYGPSAVKRTRLKPTLPKPTLRKPTLRKPTLSKPVIEPTLLTPDLPPDLPPDVPPRDERTPKKRLTSGSRRRSIPIVIILLVGLIAAAVIYLKPTGSKPEPPAPSVEAPSLADSTPVLFRYAFEKGDARSYDMTIHMNLVPKGGEGAGAQAFTGTITSTMTINVVKRLADGGSVLDVSINNVKLDPPPNGADIPTGGAQMRITLAPDGRVLYFEGTGGFLGGIGSAANGMFAGSTQASNEAQSQFLFPQFTDTAVKPGDTWKETSSLALPFGDSKTIVTATGKHLGYQNSSYGRVAKLDYKVQSPLNYEFARADLAKIAAGSQAPGSDPVAAQPGLENARFTIAGNMVMHANTLVLQKTSDLIKLEGTMKATMRIGMEGVPQLAESGQPQSIEFDQTLKMTIVRIDRSGV
jgi:hypothetical protein